MFSVGGAFLGGGPLIIKGESTNYYVEVVLHSFRVKKLRSVPLGASRF